MSPVQLWSTVLKIQLREFISNMWTQNVACHFSKVLLSYVAAIKPSAAVAPPHGVPWGEFRMENTRTLTLDNEDAYQKGNFTKFRLLHLPIQRKALKSLAWEVWFFLWLVVISRCSTTCLLLFQQKLATFPPCLLLKSSSSALWEVASQAIVLSKVLKQTITFSF